jgi:1-acyl-sn-glycerol-3-phosphate acyltransferase
MTKIRSPLFKATRAVARIILPLRFDVKIEGLQHLPSEGPAVLIPKHQQWWDVPLLGTFIPRPLYFLAKQELFANPLSRFYISGIGGIPVDRGNPLKSLHTFRSLLPLLQRKSFLVLFPEGTYYPGTLGPGKWRLIQMLLRLQLKQSLSPIAFIPVGLRYYSQNPRGSKRVEISIGPALSETNPLQGEGFTQVLLDRVGVLSKLP